MKNFKRVITVSAVSAIFTTIMSYWIFSGDWPFFPYVLLGGFFIVIIQKENKTKDFVLNLFIGSLFYSVLTSVLIFLRMYIFYFSDEYSLSFSDYWFKEELYFLILAHAFVCFMGGLIGIVLKGLYSLYGKKLDKILMFGGPLLMVFFSLFVAEVKIGRTLMSIVYGWPYPFLIHQIKDVIDGFLVDRWIVSLGSMYHYFILNYLLYLLIFISAFSVVKIVNQKKKILNLTFVLFGILIFGMISFNSYLPFRQAYIFNEIIDANYCEQDSDCELMEGSCPFGCYAVVNKKEAQRISGLIKSFPSNCVYGCIEIESARCVNKRCDF